MAERRADMLGQGGYEAELPADDGAGTDVVGEAGEAAMTPRKNALKILDGIFIGLTMVLVMTVGGLPVEWLLDLVSTTSLALEGVALVVLSAALLLIHAIAGSDHAP